MRVRVVVVTLDGLVTAPFVHRDGFDQDAVRVEPRNAVAETEGVLFRDVPSAPMF
jgi:hypothetical protein